MFFKYFYLLLFTTCYLSCSDDSTSSKDDDSIDSVTDIDGNVYNVAKIGNQWWMAENLKVTHYRNGDPIPNVTDSSEWANIINTGAYCAYDNDNGNVPTYGLLYNWHAVSDSRDIAPAGWHMPTDEEWKELEMYLGMSQSGADSTWFRGMDEGGKLKEADTTHWMSPNTGATNENGFTALPGGYRHRTGYFNFMSTNGFYWSSTESGWSAWHRQLYYQSAKVYRDVRSMRYGLSVRLVRD